MTRTDFVGRSDSHVLASQRFILSASVGFRQLPFFFGSTHNAEILSFIWRSKVLSLLPELIFGVVNK